MKPVLLFCCITNWEHCLHFPHQPDFLTHELSPSRDYFPLRFGLAAHALYILNTYVSDLFISRHMRLCFSICPGLRTAAYATRRVHPWGCTSWLLYAGGSISIYFWTHASAHKEIINQNSQVTAIMRSLKENKRSLSLHQNSQHFHFKNSLSIADASENTKCCKMGILVYFRKENPESIPELLDRKHIQALIRWLDSPQACNSNCFTSQRFPPIQIKHQKSSDACRVRRTLHLLEYSKMPCASQVSQTKPAVRLPTEVQPNCVQADPQTSSFQQRNVEKLWQVSILLSNMSSYFHKNFSPELILSLVFITAFALLVNL